MFPAMNERETSQRIDEQAADWVARRDRRALSEGEQIAFQQWLAGDARRRGALLRAEAFSLMSESSRALGPNFDPQSFAPTNTCAVANPTRRRVLAWAGAGGAVLAASVGLGFSLQGFAKISTGKGEMRLVSLDDGSSVMLNTETTLRVDYNDLVRRVTIFGGEAFFTILPDPGRLFQVEVASAVVNAMAASLSVRHLPSRLVDVLVDRGVVTIEERAGGKARIDLRAQQQVTLGVPGPDASKPRGVSAQEVSRELAWREGNIVFEGERLDAAAAEFGRYNKVVIEIRDPALAGEPISGLFSARDPGKFGKTISDLFGVAMVRNGNRVILGGRPS